MSGPKRFRELRETQAMVQNISTSFSMVFSRGMISWLFGVNVLWFYWLSGFNEVWSSDAKSKGLKCPFFLFPVFWCPLLRCSNWRLSHKGYKTVWSKIEKHMELQLTPKHSNLFAWRFEWSEVGNKWPEIIQCFVVFDCYSNKFFSTKKPYVKTEGHFASKTK